DATPERIERHDDGRIRKADIALADHRVICFDSPIRHDFTFTPAASLFVECRDNEELERLHAALAHEGSVLMPLDNYGFSRRFAWVNDRFGVSWQLNLA